MFLQGSDRFLSVIPRGGIPLYIYITPTSKLDEKGEEWFSLFVTNITKTQGKEWFSAFGVNTPKAEGRGGLQFGTNVPISAFVTKVTKAEGKDGSRDRDRLVTFPGEVFS